MPKQNTWAQTLTVLLGLPLWVACCAIGYLANGIVSNVLVGWFAFNNMLLKERSNAPKTREI